MTPDNPAPIKAARSGNVEITAVSLPRFDVLEISVVQALYAASYAVEPKKVMTASAKITARTARLTFWTEAVVGKIAVEIPQRM